MKIGGSVLDKSRVGPIGSRVMQYCLAIIRFQFIVSDLGVVLVAHDQLSFGTLTTIGFVTKLGGAYALSTFTKAVRLTTTQLTAVPLTQQVNISEMASRRSGNCMGHLSSSVVAKIRQLTQPDIRGGGMTTTIIVGREGRR